MIVTLRPRRAVIVVLLLLLPISALAEMQITATCANDTRCPVNGTLVLRDAADELTIPITGGIARFTGDATRPWEMELRADGFWSPRQRLAPTFDVWRTTSLRGKFAVENDGGDLPQKFTVVLESPFTAKAPKIARDTRIECPIAVDGSWDCPVPATQLDLTLRAKGFIPHYLWDTKLITTAPVKLAPLTLRRGASFIAWLDRDTIAALQKPASARLIRMTSADRPDQIRRLLTPVAEAAFNGRGVVQLAPVPPGTYTLEITAPGFATFRLDRIEILERSESAFRQPIHLELPLDLRFTVIPPLDPKGRPWQLRAGRRNAMNQWSPAIDLTTTATPGVFEAKDQSAGEYTVYVEDADSNEIADKTIVIHGPADALQRIELSLATVSGTVTLADEPIAAKLLFGGTSGMEKVRTTSDADGQFTATLPRLGHWVVEVSGDGIQSTVGVDIVKDKEVTIELPDTEISGFVTGPTGDRVPGARVMLYVAEGVVSRPAGTDGTFRFRGAPAGRISASDPATHEYSPTVDVVLGPGGRAENLELRLQSLRTMNGIVSSRGEKLAGALIMAQAIDGTSTSIERATSDVDGTFSVTFPANTTRLSVTVAAAGRTIQAFTVPVQDTPAQLDLAPEGGTLRVHGNFAGTRLIIQYQGAPVAPPAVAQWIVAHQRPLSGELVIPNAAPGQWRLCAGTISAATCSEGLLARGGTLDLNKP